jgi:hypothetical protein
LQPLSQNQSTKTATFDTSHTGPEQLCPSLLLRTYPLWHLTSVSRGVEMRRHTKPPSQYKVDASFPLKGCRCCHLSTRGVVAQTCNYSLASHVLCTNGMISWVCPHIIQANHHIDLTMCLAARHLIVSLEETGSPVDSKFRRTSHSQSQLIQSAFSLHLAMESYLLLGGWLAPDDLDQFHCR